MKKREKKLCIILSGMVVAAIIVAVLFIVMLKKTGGNTIIQGANINGVDIGGLTKVKAQKKFDKYIEELKNRQVIIKYGNAGKESKTTIDKLGFEVEDKDYVDKAYQIGKKGSIFKKFKEIVSCSKKDVTYKLKTNLNEDKLRKFIKLKSKIHNKKMKNSRLKMVKGKLKATKDCTGLKVNVDATVDRFSEKLNSDFNDKKLVLDAVVSIKKPKYTRKMYSKCTDLLGEYSTDYSSSTADRCSNVQTAAERINGTILKPGQTFSTVKVIKERTVENGYKAAPEYAGGKVVSGVGGGVCQVSTTLYNAVINAELEVVERSPHSMVVHYVNVSRDAAISGNYKDLKFKNNTKSGE